jgi:hypothetical protein
MVSAWDAGLVHRVIDEIWNAGDLDLAEELFGATYVNHGGLIPDLVRGPEGVKFSVAFYRTAFPDLKISANKLQTSGGMVTVGWTARGSSPGDPGRRTSADLAGSLTGETRLSLANGQIVESWTSWDSTKVLTELGIVQRAE